jgi:aminopeptidase-like protein
MTTEGEQMFRLAEEIWPLNRSLSGEGVRRTLSVLKRELPFLELKKFASGLKVFDWTVPVEWNISEAYIITPSGDKICDFTENNLHVVGYSEPFSGTISLSVLQEHLHSLPDQPNAIPYVTSYYSKCWGFCLDHESLLKLTEGDYRVVIKSNFASTGLDWAELFIPGESKKEIFFSTYICHPSMANNELSGPVLATQLAKALQETQFFYSYRFVFIPETIGSLAYMAENISEMKSNILAGYVLTCVGDEREYSYVPSRGGFTIADDLAQKTFETLHIDPIRYTWADRGSDERQYCSPGADLPVCSVMRSKYGEYPEYHTSLDTLGRVVTVEGLQGSFDFYMTLIGHVESQRFPKLKLIGEPQLGKRGLYPNLSIKGNYSDTHDLMNLISILDGKIDLEHAITTTGLDRIQALKFLARLKEEGLLEY